MFVLKALIPLSTHPPVILAKIWDTTSPRFSTVCIYDDNQIEKQKIYFLHVYICEAEQKEY